MTNRHFRMEYPGKQIPLEPLPLIYGRSILLFSFFFPSELEINNSAGNRSVLVANSLTSHPISFSLPLSYSRFSLLCSRRLFSSTLLLSAPFVSTFVCLLCVCVRLLKSLCMLVWVVIHLFLAPFPSSFPLFLSSILPSPLQIRSAVAVT